MDYNTRASAAKATAVGRRFYAKAEVSGRNVAEHRAHESYRPLGSMIRAWMSVVPAFSIV